MKLPEKMDLGAFAFVQRRTYWATSVQVGDAAIYWLDGAEVKKKRIGEVSYAHHIGARANPKLIVFSNLWLNTGGVHKFYYGTLVAYIGIYSSPQPSITVSSYDKVIAYYEKMPSWNAIYSIRDIKGRNILQGGRKLFIRAFEYPTMQLRNEISLFFYNYTKQRTIDLAFSLLLEGVSLTDPLAEYNDMKNYGYLVYDGGFEIEWVALRRLIDTDIFKKMLNLEIKEINEDIDQAIADILTQIKERGLV